MQGSLDARNRDRQPFDRTWSTSRGETGFSRTHLRLPPNPSLQSAAPSMLALTPTPAGNGVDPNTGRQQLQTSAMLWPDYGKRGEPQQRGAKVGWLIASAVRCKPLTCPRGQYADQDANKCAACTPKVACKEGEYIVGECKGNTNALKCAPCSPPGSKDMLCPNKDGTLQYRIGSCKAALHGNGYLCADQPSCSEGTMLFNYTNLKKGSCIHCPRSTCRASQYRTGTCSGTDNAYTCKECKKNTPRCSNRPGQEEYLAGSCGTDAAATGVGLGGRNNYTCAVCGNVKCGVFEYRNGACTASSKEFACLDQPVCTAGQYYKPGRDQDGGTSSGGVLPGKASCKRCPEGTFRAESARERSCIKHAAACDIKDGVTYESAAPTETSDRVCATSAKCNAEEFESKPLRHDGVRECTASTTCVAGQYVYKDPAEGTDRQCRDCWNASSSYQGQQFSNSTNADACTTMSFCGVVSESAPVLEWA